jgi:hypothetical protein
MRNRSQAVLILIAGCAALFLHSYVTPLLDFEFALTFKSSKPGQFIDSFSEAMANARLALR